MRPNIRQLNPQFVAQLCGFIPKDAKPYQIHQLPGIEFTYRDNILFWRDMQIGEDWVVLVIEEDEAEHVNTLQGQG